jgi:Leucine-rich repeat (LRR) protein
MEEYGAEMACEITMNVISAVVEHMKKVFEMRKNLRILNAEWLRMEDYVLSIEKPFQEKQRSLPPLVKKCLEEMDDALRDAEDLIKRANQQPMLFTQIQELVACCLLPTEIAEWKTRFNQLFVKLEKQIAVAANILDIVEGAPAEVFAQNVPHSGFVGEGIKFAHRKLHAWLTESSHRQSRVIGVYGVSGAGKTALLRLVHNSSLKSGRFDHVIWIDVPETETETSMIQVLHNCIADRLGLKLSVNSTHGSRTSRLSAFLKPKRFLLILDGVQRSINLVEDIGLQFGDHDMSKVLISSRNKGEVKKMADEGYYLKIQTLSSTDGWELFEREAAAARLGLKNREKIARDIALECGGLPSAIKAVSTEMKTIDDWERLLDMMREIDVETLVEIWSAEDLTDRMDDGRINVLVNSCLIEYVESIDLKPKRRIKVQKVLRDLAIYIGQNEEHWLFATDRDLQNFPSEGQIKDCTRISLGYNNIHCLPTRLNCPELLSLVLAYNEELKDVPESFFSNLGFLTVLDLSCTSITSLPTSVEKLGQLKFLNLRECKSLNELPEKIGKLVHLQFLDLTNCASLKRLHQIRELENLKHLKLEGCYKLEVDSEDISQLTSLQKLVLPVRMLNAKELEITYLTSALKWRLVRPVRPVGNLPIRLWFWSTFATKLSRMCTSEIRMSASAMDMEDLTNLSNLRELVVTVKSKKMVDTMCSWSKMRNLTIQYIHDTELEIVAEDILPQGTETMKNLQSLCIINYQGEKLPKCISYFQYLKELELSICNQLRRLPAMENGSESSFERLETLKLTQLNSMEGLFGGRNEISMANLKHLSIMYCPSLNRLSIGMETLPKLEELFIRRCRQLKELTIGDKEGKAGGFPVLETLSLKNLRKLRSIAELSSDTWNERTMPKPRNLTIVNCPLLKRLPIEWNS